MSEAADYQPAPGWGGHNFKSARAAYQQHAGRSYTDAKVARVQATDLVPVKLVLTGTAGLFFNSDLTGSMGDKPAIMFSKAPYLDHECKEYLGPETDFVFGANTDCTCDQYPCQIHPPVRGPEIAQALKFVFQPDAGGGQTYETYEINALYFARNVEMPNMIHKPVLIFSGDESPYPQIDPEMALKFAHVDLGGQPISTEEVFRELREKFSVYFVQSGYCGTTNENDYTTRRVRRDWAKLVGEDHIAFLPDANRYVDVVFGILACETERAGYFQDELTDRQMKDEDGPAKIAVVMKALETILAAPAKDQKALPSGSSILLGADTGKDADSLL